MPSFMTFGKREVDLNLLLQCITNTRYLTPGVWPAEYREAIISKLKDALDRHQEMQRFINYIESNPNIRDYAKMRKYNRDIEERYQRHY